MHCGWAPPNLKSPILFPSPTLPASHKSPPRYLSHESGTKELSSLPLVSSRSSYVPASYSSPLFLDSGGIITLGILLAMGLTCGQLISPIYSEWVSNTILENIRGRFTGRQMIAQLVTGIIASSVVGWYLDLYTDTDRYTGFLSVFLSAILLGAGGYLNLMRVPFSRSADTISLGNLFEPVRNKRFRNLLVYFMTWSFASGLLEVPDPCHQSIRAASPVSAEA